MARELMPYRDEFADPEACYRRGFQHGAAVLLEFVADKLEPNEARYLAQWVGGDLHDWRVLGNDVSASSEPPRPSARARLYRAVGLDAAGPRSE